MATPNINDATKNITGYTIGVALSTTNPTLLLGNSVGSNSLIRISSVYAANVDASNAVSVTLTNYSADALGGTATRLANAVSINPFSSMVLVNRESPIYLRENQSLGATASAANRTEIVIVYEVIS